MVDTDIKKQRVVTSYTDEKDVTETRASAKQSNKDSSSVNKGGRPTLYSLEIALEICDRIADGESLVKICSVYEWLLRYKEFADIYARAREDQADTLADEIHAISDELPQQIVDDKGKTRYDSAYVQWQKNRVDARKWVAAKLKPKKYSDRIAHVGDNEADSINVNVNIFDEMLKNLELKRQAK